MAATRPTEPPKEGGRIEIKNGKLQVPDQPIIPFIEGDGTGRDIWRASQRVFDAAVDKAYGGKRRLVWYEVLAGEKSFNETGEWLPQQTYDAFKEYLVGIKGPLTTPIGGGIRSLNVALRQRLDLYVCLRPVKYFKGVPSPVNRPEDVDMVIFRENTEDIYAGIEYAAETPEAKKVISFLQDEMGVKNIRFPGNQRDRHQANQPRRIAAPNPGRDSVRARSRSEQRDPGPQRQRDEVHRRCLSRLGLPGGGPRFPERNGERARELDPLQSRSGRQHLRRGQRAVDRARLRPDDGRQQGDNARKEVEACLSAIWGTHGDGKWKKKVLVRDAIADITFQQVLTRAKQFDVIATMNLNGDFLSDALAAQIGGIGIAPGGNINYDTGHAIFEATHGTAPKYADKDQVNPGSVILSGVMMFRHLGWNEVADSIEKAIEKTIAQKRVTYDFHRLMEGATKLKTSEFAGAIIENL